MTPPKDAYPIIQDGRTIYIKPNGDLFNDKGRFLKNSSPTLYNELIQTDAAISAFQDLGNVKSNNNLLMDLNNKGLLSQQQIQPQAQQKKLFSVPDVDTDAPFIEKFGFAFLPEGMRAKSRIEGQENLFNKMQELNSYYKTKQDIDYEDFKRRKDYEKSLKTKNKREIQAKFLETFQANKELLDLFPVVQQALHDLPSSQKGPIMGSIVNSLPNAVKGQFFKESASLDAAITAIKQVYGTYMEKGVLKRDDEPKYKIIFPKQSDNADTVRFKLELMNWMVAAKVNSTYDVLNNSDHDMVNLQKVPIPKFPRVGNDTNKKIIVEIAKTTQDYKDIFQNQNRYIKGPKQRGVDSTLMNLNNSQNIDEILSSFGSGN